MNYLIESSFFDINKRKAVLWAERLLHDLITSQDKRRILNNVNKLEKKILDIMSRCFNVECFEENEIFYLRKKGKPRAPYLCFRDYLTEGKIQKNFIEEIGYFHDDIQYFPVNYRPLDKMANIEGYEVKPTKPNISNEDKNTGKKQPEVLSDNKQSEEELIIEKKK